MNISNFFNIFNFEIKKIELLTKKQHQSNENAKFAIFLKKKLKINMLKVKNITKLGTILIMQVNIEELHIAYVI